MPLKNVRNAIAFIVVTGLLYCGTQSSIIAQGYTPEHPTIVKMVDQLASQLEQQLNDATRYKDTEAFSGAYGERALHAYAHYKARYDKTSPVVQKGIDASKEFITRLGEPNNKGHQSKANYQAAICAMLLAEVDPKKYKSDLKRLSNFFKNSQFSYGPYSYPGEPTGDVSQTQYAMLALWKLDRLGIKIDYKGVQKTGQWLMSVQDQGGGWPYQGELPRGGNRINQAGVTPSMAVAGGSALLIAGDILRSWGATFGEADDPGIPDLPKAVKLYLGESGGTDNRAKANLSADKIRDSISECDGWLRSNSADPGVMKSKWPMYQLYTLERYRSFREIAFEEPEGKSPAWYNGGVKYIQKAIAGDNVKGYAKSTESNGASFAILFLIRSTKKSIAAFSAGQLTGGRDLPDDTSDIKVEGTQIKPKSMSESVTDMLNSLENSKDKLNGMSIPATLKLAKEPKERAAQLDRLQRLARGSQSWQARRVALRLLGQSDNIDMVPTLIYGLGDKDKVCRIYARDGLRFISRKFDGFGLAINANEGEVYSAVNEWKSWYKSVRPTYIFID